MTIKKDSCLRLVVGEKLIKQSVALALNTYIGSYFLYTNTWNFWLTQYRIPRNLHLLAPFWNFYCLEVERQIELIFFVFGLDFILILDCSWPQKCKKGLLYAKWFQHCFDLFVIAIKRLFEEQITNKSGLLNRLSLSKIFKSGFISAAFR